MSYAGLGKVLRMGRVTDPRNVTEILLEFYFYDLTQVHIDVQVNSCLNSQTPSFNLDGMTFPWDVLDLHGEMTISFYHVSTFRDRVSLHLHILNFPFPCYSGSIFF